MEDTNILTGNDRGGGADMGQADHPDQRAPADRDTAGPEAAELEAAREEYRRLAASIAELGLVHHGSIVHRFARQDDEGPGTAGKARGRKSYYQWTSKVAGKTISRTLSTEEAALYREWIANDRELRSILQQMRRVSEHAINLILEKEIK